MPFNLGVVGCGAIGSVHAQVARRAGITIAAAWDLVPERAKTLVTKHGGRTMASLAELLSLKEVDAVAIAVPNDRHRECACAALRAGKHVLLEKPMALSKAECDEILSVARECGDGANSPRLQIGLLCRGAPAVKTVRRFVDDGTFGSIYHIKASAYRQRGIPGLGGWFTSRQHSGGGPLIDLGVHVLDAALHLAGQPRVERVSAMTWAKFGSPIKDYRFASMWAGPPRLDGVFDVEDSATALIRCAGGLAIELSVSWAGNHPDGSLKDGLVIWGTSAGASFELLGQSAAIAVEQDGLLVDIAPKVVASSPSTPTPLDQAWDEEYRNFITLVTRGGASCASGEESRAMHAVIDAIYESSRLGREVELA
ncbi:MAG: Gfo/Idh/MocA family oxidoreductase [Phycisphaerales bacterium]|nr:Gfo/Idh/MocA family oxidoreductase [Phycisphaerales bacterium]